MCYIDRCKLPRSSLCEFTTLQIEGATCRDFQLEPRMRSVIEKCVAVSYTMSAQPVLAFVGGLEFDASLH